MTSSHDPEAAAMCAGPPDDVPPAPALTISGNPTPEEVAAVVAFRNATLATRRALPLTWTGLPPAGPRQLRLAHTQRVAVGASRRDARWGQWLATSKRAAGKGTQRFDGCFDIRDGIQARLFGVGGLICVFR